MIKEKREAIAKAANSMRTALSLNVPVQYDALKEALIKIGGTITEKHSDYRNDIYPSVILKTKTDFEIFIIESTEQQKIIQLLHAFGHLLLHLRFLQKDNEVKEPLNFVESFCMTNYVQTEMETNEFARQFLLPIESFAKEYFIQKKDTRKLAKYYNLPDTLIALHGHFFELGI